MMRWTMIGHSSSECTVRGDLDHNEGICEMGNVGGNIEPAF